MWLDRVLAALRAFDRWVWPAETQRRAQSEAEARERVRATLDAIDQGKVADKPHQEPSITRPDAGVAPYFVLIGVLVGGYVGWVMLTGWAVLRLIGPTDVPTSAWLVIVGLASVLGIIAMYVGGRIKDGLVPWALLLTPIVVELFAFGLVRAQ